MKTPRERNGDGMSKRKIDLDFSSLVDIALIVIFVFAIFGRMNSAEQEARAEAKIDALEVSVAEAEEREAYSEKKRQQSEEELRAMRDSAERYMETAEGVLEYVKGGNAKLILQMQESGWKVRLISKDTVVAEIDSKADMGKELIMGFQAMGYDTGNTVFCDFVFDGSLPGSAAAYRKITKGLEVVLEQYEFLYYSETDVSVGKE